MFGIDDAHWVDADSWEFLQDLAVDPNAILVMTARPLRKEEKQSAAMLGILNHPHTKVLKLEGLCPDDMLTLACNFINVDSLPEPLQQIIRERSHGVPQWCEELVETMVELQYLKVRPPLPVIASKYVSGDPQIVEVSDSMLDEGGEEDQSSGGDLPDLVGMAVEARGRKRRVVLRGSRRRSSCQLSSGVGIANIPIPDSVTGMVLARIDHMSATEQMALKCAAILGTSFSRTMLQAIVPNYSPTAFHAALNTLAQAGMVECAIAAETRVLQSDIQTRSRDHLPVDDPQHHCPCLTREHIRSPNHASTALHAKDHPPVDSCKMLQFVHAYVQETAYGLWTESQRTFLHESSALYLESQAHKCTNCGGGGFLTGHKTPAKKQQQQRSSNAGGSPARPATARGSVSTQNRLRRISTSARRRSSVAPEIFTDTPPDPRRLSLALPLSRVAEYSADLTEIQEPAQSGVRYNSIGEVDIFGIDLQDCHCDEVLAHVYPQLVRHWRAARDMHKTVEYLIESASAAVATFNNMEALAFLHEARELVTEHGEELLSEEEQIKMESISGQVCEKSRI